MIRSVLKPFTDFPRNLNALTNSSGSSTVNINIKPDTGINVNTTSSIQELPDLIGQLYSPDIAPSLTASDAQEKLTGLLGVLDVSAARRSELSHILSNSNSSESSNTDPIQKRFQNRFDTLKNALALDVSENKALISDFGAWKEGNKKPEDISIIAQNLPNSVHLAQAAPSMFSHFLSLDPNLFHPLIQSVSTVWGSSLPLQALSVSPTPETVSAPGEGSSFSGKAPNTTSLQRTRGLYITNGSTTQRLVDYTENLSKDSLVYAIDDDHDGDQDVFYSIDKIIYRKENHKKPSQKYYITDAPRVYDTQAIYSEFFGLSSSDISMLVGDAQIKLLRSNTYSRINYQFLSRRIDSHMRLLLFKSLFQRNPADSVYTIDILPKDTTTISKHTVLSIPHILSTEWRVTIQHNSLYRTLITNQQFIDSNGKVQSLSDDFVIRSGQSGYAQDTTVIAVTNNWTTTNFTLQGWQKIVFASDSNVRVRKWALILFGSTTEKRSLTIQDSW
jgi:hypothetical protein